MVELEGHGVHVGAETEDGKAFVCLAPVVVEVFGGDAVKLFLRDDVQHDGAGGVSLEAASLSVISRGGKCG